MADKVFRYVQYIKKKIGEYSFMINKLFQKKSKTKEITTTKNKELVDVKKIESPKILLIDLPEEVNKKLSSHGYVVNNATLGSLIKLPIDDIKRNFLCQPDYYFPNNVHEYEVIVLDLNYFNEKSITNFEKNGFLVSFPKNYLYSSPLGADVLRSLIDENKSNKYILIVFTNKEIISDYEFSSINYINRIETQQKYKLSNYSFHKQNLTFNPYSSENKSGKEINIIGKGGNVINDKFYSLLSKYRDDMSYEIIFEHPKEIYYDNNTSKYRKKDNFFPLITNKHSEIVSFINFETDTSAVIFLPQIKNKGDFLIQFFDELSGFFPNIFEYNSAFKWLESTDYFLPNQNKLLEEKKQIIENFQKNMENVEKKIKANHNQFMFLHKLISESGDSLVKSVEKFLIWLGFSNVKNMDELNLTIKEEDLQVEPDNRLLVIEVKGIGGTSTDDECRQIGKIKSRRIEDRRSFDIYGLYIVNHQRFKEPLVREHTPFKPQQIKDAIYEKRGLLTTWDLYNLYFDIENGIITKEEARECFFKFGRVTFEPNNLFSLGIIKDIVKDGDFLKKGNLIILNLNDEKLIKEDYIFYKIEKNRFLKSKILNLQVNNKNIEEVSTGEVGIELEIPVKKSYEIFIKKKSVV
jgi:hypothetical protein